MTDHGPKYYIQEGYSHMVCGATHVEMEFQHKFRPRYFTAKLRNGALQELRLADLQHASVLGGDDRGVYGNYAPKQTD